MFAGGISSKGLEWRNQKMRRTAPLNLARFIGDVTPCELETTFLARSISTAKETLPFSPIERAAEILAARAEFSRSTRAIFGLVTASPGPCPCALDETSEILFVKSVPPIAGLARGNDRQVFRVGLVEEDAGGYVIARFGRAAAVNAARQQPFVGVRP